MIGKLHTKQCGNYSFMCWYWERSDAWGHEARLMRDGVEVAAAKLRYYNRTWERFEFQSVMREAVENYKNSMIAREIEKYKREHDTDRLPRGGRQMITRAAEENEDIKMLIKCADVPARHGRAIA